MDDLVRIWKRAIFSVISISSCVFPASTVARFSNVRRASSPFYRKFNLPAAPKSRSHCQIAARARELKRNKSGFKRIARTMRAVSLSFVRSFGLLLWSSPLAGILTSKIRLPRDFRLDVRMGCGFLCKFVFLFLFSIFFSFGGFN